VTDPILESALAIRDGLDGLSRTLANYEPRLDALEAENKWLRDAVNRAYVTLTADDLGPVATEQAIEEARDILAEAIVRASS
jgi:hypothetical protein